VKLNACVRAEAYKELVPQCPPGPCIEEVPVPIIAQKRQPRRNLAMAKLRHVALIVEDPEASARFFEQAFDMTRAGTGRRGIYMSDGVHQCRALEEGKRKERIGIYHFGMWVDDLEAAEKKVVDAGGVYSRGARPRPIRSIEAKYRDPSGIVFDLTHTGWAARFKDVRRKIAAFEGPMAAHRRAST